jgi:hypothetical protein
MVKPKIPIWVNFGGPWNGKGWCIIWPFVIDYGHLVHIFAIWQISGNLVSKLQFGIMSPLFV